MSVHTIAGLAAMTGVAVLAGVVVPTVGSQSARSAVIVPNSTITISGVNLPSGNASVDTTVGATVSVGGLSIHTSIVHDGPDSDWLVLDAVTGRGNILAGNINSAWSISVTGLDFLASNNFDSVFLYWTEDGVPFDPINSFGGIVYQGKNDPIDPSIGPVFTNSGFSVPNISDFTPIVSVSPYNFVSSGGIDPNTANDFHEGLRFTLSDVTPPVDVPEPNTLALLMGFLGAGFLSWRRSAT